MEETPKIASSIMPRHRLSVFLKDAYDTFHPILQPNHKLTTFCYDLLALISGLRISFMADYLCPNEQNMLSIVAALSDLIIRWKSDISAFQDIKIWDLVNYKLKAEDPRLLLFFNLSALQERVASASSCSQLFIDVSESLDHPRLCASSIALDHFSAFASVAASSCSEPGSVLLRNTRSAPPLSPFSKVPLTALIGFLLGYPFPMIHGDSYRALAEELGGKKSKQTKLKNGNCLCMTELSLFEVDIAFNPSIEPEISAVIRVGSSSGRKKDSILQSPVMDKGIRWMAFTIPTALLPELLPGSATIALRDMLLSRLSSSSLSPGASAELLSTNIFNTEGIQINISTRRLPVVSI